MRSHFIARKVENPFSDATSCPTCLSCSLLYLFCSVTRVAARAAPPAQSGIPTHVSAGETRHPTCFFITLTTLPVLSFGFRVTESPPAHTPSPKPACCATNIQRVCDVAKLLCVQQPRGSASVPHLLTLLGGVVHPAVRDKAQARRRDHGARGAFRAAVETRPRRRR